MKVTDRKKINKISACNFYQKTAGQYLYKIRSSKCIPTNIIILKCVLDPNDKTEKPTPSHGDAFSKKGGRECN